MLQRNVVYMPQTTETRQNN